MDSGKVIHGKYFPHIDGIRTIAVLSVVLYHIFGNLCPGGYVGVDIFFVISGYLITGGILKSLDKGTFSIKDFYERRIRRIIPAYVVIIAFVMLLALILPPNLMEGTFSASAFSSIFATNFFFPFQTGGYFDLGSETNPLLHLWSLSVEEQFYIFAPIFLFLIYKINKKLVLSSLLIIVALSLACSLYYNYRGGNTLNFYMLPTRTWELMAGSLFAYWNKASPSIRQRGGGAIRFLGILGIIIAILVCYLYNSSTPFPGITAVPPVLGALLMIRWGNIGISQSILESKPFVGIGKISYSLYLWHWPLIVYWKYISNDPSSPWGLLAVLALSFLMAWLSWRFVEMPIRLSKSWNFKRALLWVIIGCGGIGISSCVLLSSEFPRIWATHWIKQWAGKDNYLQKYWEGNPHHLYDIELSAVFKNIKVLKNPSPRSCLTLGKSTNPTYVLWGDSHAMALSPGFNDFSNKNGINGIFLNKRFPLSFPFPEIPEQSFDKIISWINAHPELKTIIFINRWATRIGENMNEEQLQGSQPLESKLRDICLKFKKMNKTIVFISSIPEQNVDIHTTYYQSIFSGTYPKGISFQEYLTRQHNSSKILRKIEQEGLAQILWVDGFFFPIRGFSKIFNSQGIPLYVDGDHLNPTGAKELINYYNNELLHILSADEKPDTRQLRQGE